MGVKSLPVVELIASERVRCLSCDHVYEKPASGGTSSRNPGCPKCGYVGWVSELIALPDIAAYETATA